MVCPLCEINLPQNNNENVSTIQDNIINYPSLPLSNHENSTEKKTEEFQIVCPLGDKLSFFNNPDTECAKCHLKNKFYLGCSEHQFFLCLYTCTENLFLKYKTSPQNSCLLNHKLTWSSGDYRKCLNCQEYFEDGFSCNLCLGFSLCINCSGFKFSYENCPNSHLLIWNPSKNICTRCKLNSNGFKCEECKYSLCGTCKDPLLKEYPFSTLDFLDEINYNFVTPEIINLQSHESNINTLIILDHENTLVSGSNDKTIKIWKNFENVLTLNGHNSWVNTLIKLNKNTFASGSSDNTIKIWEDFKCIITLDTYNSPVYSLINLDENTFASGGGDSTIKIWRNYECINTLTGHGSYIYCLLKIDDNKIASGSNDMSIKIWKDYKCIETLVGHSSWVYSLVKLEVNVIASGSYQEIKIWKDYKCVLTLTDHTGWVKTLVKLDENRFMSGSGDQVIKIWDDYKCVISLVGHFSAVNSIVKIDENMIGSASSDKMIKIWKNYKEIK